MHIKYFKIFFFIILIFKTTPLYSKIDNNKKFNLNDFSNYFSAVVSYDNNGSGDSLKFFSSSKNLLNSHQPYLKKYIYSLILNGRVKRALQELRFNGENENSNFVEAYFLLTIDSLKKKEFLKADNYLIKARQFSRNNTFDLIIYETLKNYSYLFKNNKINNDSTNFGDLTSINKALQSCYLGSNNTIQYFDSLTKNEKVDYSRYIYFYTNYLLKKKKFESAKKIVKKVDTLDSSLLILQTKLWVENEQFKKVGEIFSCESQGDILGEFFFVISNLYSSEANFEKSNFYMNISNFLNPKFKFNLSLLANNYLLNENYEDAKKTLNNFEKDNQIYYWYKIKQNAQILSKKDKELASDYINSKFKEIKNPSIKILFDMANISRDFNNYEIAIEYYDKIIPEIDHNSKTYADLLYKRGGSHERLGNFEMADKDLLKSLEVDPSDAYALNYLAYSWLERNMNLEIAIEMLEKAYSLQKNDPYILDSVGWGYYLAEDFVNAEKFLKKSILLMPDDPIVNDHYGDVLWRLGKKIQATYFWQKVLNSKETKEQMKENINFKILKGLQKNI